MQCRIAGWPVDNVSLRVRFPCVRPVDNRARPDRYDRDATPDCQKCDEIAKPPDSGSCGMAAGHLDLQRNAPRSMSPSDPFDLARFSKAQSAYYTSVLQELAAGQKRGTWMDVFFPQLSALSTLADSDGISGLPEARAYFNHRLLGPRLLVCTRAALSHKTKTVESIFGEQDAGQFRASMTLFAQTDSGTDLFHEALERYWDGRPHERTLALLAQPPAAAAAGGGP